MIKIYSGMYSFTKQKNLCGNCEPIYSLCSKYRLSLLLLTSGTYSGITTYVAHLKLLLKIEKSNVSLLLHQFTVLPKFTLNCLIYIFI